MRLFVTIHTPAINSAPRSAKTRTTYFKSVEDFENTLDNPRYTGLDSRGYRVDNPQIIAYGVEIDGKNVDCLRDEAIAKFEGRA